MLTVLVLPSIEAVAMVPVPEPRSLKKPPVVPGPVSVPRHAFSFVIWPLSCLGDFTVPLITKAASTGLPPGGEIPSVHVVDEALVVFVA